MLARVLRFIQVIQRMLGALAELADRFRIYGDGRERRMAAKLDTVFQMDPGPIPSHARSDQAPGETVLLLAWNKGVMPDRRVWHRYGSFAQLLARELNASVQAPDNFGWLGKGTFQSADALSRGQPVRWDRQNISPAGLTFDHANTGTILEFQP